MARCRNRCARCCGQDRLLGGLVFAQHERRGEPAGSASEPFLQVVDLALGPGQWPVHWNRRQLAGWRLCIPGVLLSEVDTSGQQQGWLLVRQPRLAAEQLGQELGDGHDGEGILVDQEGAQFRARAGRPRAAR